MSSDFCQDKVRTELGPLIHDSTGPEIFVKEVMFGQNFEGFTTFFALDNMVNQQGLQPPFHELTNCKIFL